jgi:hypothetical protein
MVWIVGRTQQQNPADIPAARAVQAHNKLTPLRAWGTNYTPLTYVAVDSPNVDTKTPLINPVASMIPVK